MFVEWLQERMTVEEAEALHAIHDDRLGPEPVPFGFLNDRWQMLKDMMQPGDEIWTFSSPPASWEILAGRAGVALVRDGEVVDAVVLKMN